MKRIINYKDGEALNEDNGLFPYAIEKALTTKIQI